MTTATTAQTAAPHHESSIKETLISMVISLAMALVAKSYVVEAFVIPTGSMAPTLLGKHMQFQSDASSYRWAVNPWFYKGDTPLSMQWGGAQNAPLVTDPMSSSTVNSWVARQQPSDRTIGFTPPLEPKRLRDGDRILVQKYLYEVFPPKRFDVVVFKNPSQATENYIKRLIGLPNEQIWLADGDVFTRPISTRADGTVAVVDTTWEVARKPARIQKALWRPIYSSEYAPLALPKPSVNFFTTPWNGAAWKGTEGRTYRCDAADVSSLSWDAERWPITDWVSYNDSEFGQMYRRSRFPVSDLRLRAGVRPDNESSGLSANIRALGHEFRAVIDATNASVQMRAVGESDSPWQTLDIKPFGGLHAGRITNVEFWHVDQTLQLWIDGKRIAYAEYDWGADERVMNATGVNAETLANVTTDPRVLSKPDNYKRGIPAAWWTFEGSPVTLERVALDRDLFYEPAMLQRVERPALATHPANLPSLGKDQFFVCGDNSPSSQDGRLWDSIDPWVADQIDETMGVVPRRLMLGKAFYVYFPAPHIFGKGIPVPDLGRMRLIK